MSAFLEKFKLNTDLIYGRGEAINLYILHYKDVPYFRKWPATGVKTRLRPEQFETCIKAKKEGFFAINTYNEHLTNAAYAKTRPGLGDKDSGKYVEGIDKSAYKPDLAKIQTTKNPLHSKAKILETLDKHKDRLSKSSTKIGTITYEKEKGETWGDVWAEPDDLRAIVDAAYDLCIRRSCKFGIDYTTGELKGRIHYALDGLTIGSVCDKATITNGSGYEKIPICTSELRFIFRNWGRLKGKVLFYEKFEASVPPWKIEAKEKWKAYAVDRLRKFWKQIAADPKGQGWLMSWGADPTKPESAAELLKANRDPDKFIDSFHMIPVNFVNKEAAELT